MNKRPTAFIIACIFLSYPLGLSALQEDDDGSWDASLSESEYSEESSFIIHTQDDDIDDDSLSEISQDPPDELLMSKIEDGSLDQRYLRYLIDLGADIHADNDAPLRLAAELDNVPIVTILLRMGADIHVLDDEILIKAIAAKQRAVVEKILDWSKRRNVGYFSACLIYELYEKNINIDDVDDGFEQTEIAILLEAYLEFLKENLSYIDNQLIHEVTCQEIQQVARLLDQQANIHTADDLVLTIAVFKRDVALVELLLEYAQPSKYGLFSLDIVMSCISYLQDETAVSNQIFRLIGNYLYEYCNNLENITNKGLVKAVLDNDLATTRRWLELGADIHYLQDGLLEYVVKCNQLDFVTTFLQWSFNANQTLFQSSVIRKLSSEAYEEEYLPSMELLIDYEKNCQLLLEPER